MRYSPAHLRRVAQLDSWFSPARFGLFYHWGLATGGGCTNRLPERRVPLRYPSPEALEAAAGAPEAVADRMVRVAADCGARYATLTTFHSCGGYCAIYPTRVQGFRARLRGDYLGAFLRAAKARGVKPMLYLPLDPSHSISPDGPWLDENVRDNRGFSALLKQVVDELAERYGADIAGFWLDGMAPEYQDLPAYLHRRFPAAVVVNNNNTTLDIDEVDCGTTEFLAADPVPAYCRPNGLRTVEPKYKVSIPGPDFNEDIPTCNGWFHYEGPMTDESRPYVEDDRFLLRQMLSSLGQRGQWNYALGIGLLADGSAPRMFHPGLAKVGAFMSWGAEAVYDTTGGEYSPVTPGYFNGSWKPQGFCSVTWSRRDPAAAYVLVTTAPECDEAMFHTRGAMPRRVTDLRSGKEVPFTMRAGVYLGGVDWRDVDECGVKVFRLDF